MLSSSFNIIEFIEKVKDHSFEEIIWMTDKEATEAERYLLRIRRQGERDKVVSYAGCLKDFILFMRYGVRTRTVKHLPLEAFNEKRVQ
jgi:hypothetical protein